MTEITELCLAGAANRGLCYIGALKKLEELKVLKLNKIVATSIGACIGFLYIIGYSIDELLDTIIIKDSEELFDVTLSGNGSILKGESIREWIINVASKKIDTDITYAQLYEKTQIDFITTGVCIISGQEHKEGLHYFSREKTPDMKVLTSIFITMAYPLIFPPVEYMGSKFIDGGFLNNFPIELIDDKKGLGIITTHKPIDLEKYIHNPVMYVQKLHHIISDHTKNYEKNENVITVECYDFENISFKQTLDDKITLYKRGYSFTEKYFKKTYDL